LLLCWRLCIGAEFFFVYEKATFLLQQVGLRNPGARESLIYNVPVAEAVRIGIFGDYDPTSPTLPAVEKSLQHAAEHLKIPVAATWLPTPSLLDPELDKKLEAFDGLWAAPGSPYKSFDGMLRGIEFARRREWPFLATCGGFQYTLIECARNLLGMADANSAENNPPSGQIVISPVSCEVPNRAGDAPKLSGRMRGLRIRPGSSLQGCYQKDVVDEEFFCNFEVNPDFEWAFAEAGFPIVARGENNEPRAIEFQGHRFFIATLFQPQLSSKPGKPHPVIVAFLRAAAEWKTQKLEDAVLG
jgi:CTP synthase (UTP-ammonia lyase)